MIATGGLRVPADFAKALAMGAEAIAVSNSALQAIGCIAARMCMTGGCPSNIATQSESKRKAYRDSGGIEKGAEQLKNFFDGSTHLMSLLARACGHDKLSQFTRSDLTTWKREMADLSGVAFGGDAEDSGSDVE